jgi:hypothetical protein
MSVAHGSGGAQVMDQLRYRVSPTVRASVSVDGLVLLDIQGGLVLASNAIGARIWTLIEQTCNRREIARQLTDDYGVPLARAQGDVDAFIAALIARGLVAEDPS